jgi:hypothetical protein
MNTETRYALKTTFFFIFLQSHNFSYKNAGTDQECITEKILWTETFFTIIRSTNCDPQIMFG